MTSSEPQLEEQFFQKLRDLKVDFRADVRDRAAIERNFQVTFQALDHVALTDDTFQRLLEKIITGEALNAACMYRAHRARTGDNLRIAAVSGNQHDITIGEAPSDRDAQAHANVARRARQRLLVAAADFP